MSITQQNDERILFQAFVDRVRANLKAAVLEAVNPQIEDAVNKAVAELNSTIERHYDVRRDQMVHHLVVHYRR